MILTAEDHPIYHKLDPAVEQKLLRQGNSELIEQYERTRAMMIGFAKHDPLRNGFEPEIWKVADRQVEELRKLFPHGVTQLLNLGGNRASKTQRAAKRIMQLMIQKPGARVWCLNSTETVSKSDQQPLIFSMIPPEWRPQSGRLKPKGDRSTKIVYSDADGFTKNTFILPNGSQCWFKFFAANVKTLEGAELDMVWADELVPPDWIEALIFRLVNRNGHLLITFTPVEHFSDTVKIYLSNAKTLDSEKEPLLPIYDSNGNLVDFEQQPRVQQSGVSTARIVYFRTQDNPFGNYEGMKAEVQGSPRERILLRVCGVPSMSQGSQFSFVEDVHKISRAQFQEIVRKYPNGTRYHLVDPCSGRNWFMAWAFCPYNVEVVSADGSTSTQPKVIWYREWPSPGKYIEGVGDPGVWAAIGGTLQRHDSDKSPADGDRGPAQKPFRFGLKRYIEEILRLEKIPALVSDGKATHEHITERWIDSRYANAAVTDREEQTTLIEQLQTLGMIFMAMVAERKILDVNDGSIDLINSALYYDKTIPIGQFAADMGRVNEPLMQVTEDCPNMIFSLSNWTGLDGQHGACKDPIDIIRGFYLSRLCHVDAGMFETRGGGCY